VYGGSLGTPVGWGEGTPETKMAEPLSFRCRFGYNPQDLGKSQTGVEIEFQNRREGFSSELFPTRSGYPPTPWIDRPHPTRLNPTDVRTEALCPLATLAL